MCVNCIICLDPIFLPVEIICFSCYKNNEFNCSSLIRICLRCAISFLQLDKDIEARDFYKKCVYCPSLAYLHRLNFDNGFKKDFLIMSNDQNIYNCPYCFFFSGTQLDINNHLEKECPKYYILCECKKVFIKENFYLHLFHCDKHLRCDLCKKFIIKKKIIDHMHYIHDHMFCNLCKTFVPKNLFEKHIESECPERLIICTFCLQLITFNKYIEHLFEHKTIVLEEMTELSQKYNVILDKYTKINELIKPFNNLLEQKDE